jgi:glycosyltransferase involved in cell wall biosynthesis
MRVFFDAYWLQNGPPSGSGVVEGLLSGWTERFPDDELFAMVPRQSLPWARAQFPTVTFIGVAVRNHAVAVQFVLGRLASAAGADGVVSQNFTPTGDVPAYVFVHDVLFRTNPEWFSVLERLYLAQISWGLRRRPMVLTSSRTEAARIKSFYPFVREVVPVGLGVPPALLSAEPIRPSGVPSQFLLSVGRLNIRKNLGAVVRAHAKAIEEDAVLSPLVIVGPAAGVDFDSLDNIGTGITWLGAVSHGELRWLYEHASGLVFASLDEGYGLPPVEALAFGCPVLVSDIPVMHEVVGTSGLYFDPRSLTDLKRGLLEIDASPRRQPVRPLTWSDVTADIREVVRVKD